MSHASSWRANAVVSDARRLVPEAIGGPAWITPAMSGQLFMAGDETAVVGRAVLPNDVSSDTLHRLSQHICSSGIGQFGPPAGGC